MSDVNPTIRPDESNGGQAMVEKPRCVSQRLITELERETDVDLTDGVPLQRHVDLEALDSLFHVETTDGEAPTVTFWFQDYEITIHGTDEIEITN